MEMSKVICSEWFQYGMEKPERTYHVIDSLIPPGMLELNGKKYIMPGWYELDPDEDVKLEDIKWTPWKAPEDPQLAGLDKTKQYHVTSSKGDKQYTVQFNTSGSLECSCVGYGFRKSCRHIEQVKIKN